MSTIALAPDEDATEAELDRLLADQPHSIVAHLRMGRLRAQLGRDALACNAYREALRLAESQGVRVNDNPDLLAAHDHLDSIQGRLYSEWEAKLSERALPPESWSPRLREALEISAGKRKLFRQEPTDFTYPGLPSIQFFDREQFDWVRDIEGAAGEIREELQAELNRGTHDFRAYIQSHSSDPQANIALLGNRDWSILALCEQGWVSQGVVQRFPRTWTAIKRAPLPAIHGWGPTVVFSLLKAGARIPAHNGMFNTRLICHLPLIVPPNCGFRVGNEVRLWEEGKLLIFDDTIEHEAWNDSHEDRVVLIFDIWRPELTETERKELLALFHP